MIPSANMMSSDREQCNTEQDEWRGSLPQPDVLKQRLHEQVGRVIDLCSHQSLSFLDFEVALIPLIATLGRLAFALFLCLRHHALSLPTAELRGGKTYERRQSQPRLIATVYGKVRYWRTYMYSSAAKSGYYPLDHLLNMAKDGFSAHVVNLMTRIATKVSYEQTKLVLQCFLNWSPATQSIENAVLGLGRHTGAWFENAPAPEEDGEVLIIQFDGKCPPTATETELEKRRGKRRPQEVHDSPRHRSRGRRKRNGKKPKRKKGDKSKNGKMVTTVVMYTLKKGVDKNGKAILKGPINKRVYSSFAPKRHGFAYALREATKRGFGPGCGKLIQIMTDGDEDYERYAKEFFPEAIHTLDCMHALEYIWKAGRCIYREGSTELEHWGNEQRQRLYSGQIKLILNELRLKLEKIPKGGPGNKGKRKRLEQAINYLDKRRKMMNYKELIEQDLEISSGEVEGAVKYVVSQRFDAMGMRWIKERAEALLQLRCIEINGDWDKFIRFIHDKANKESVESYKGLSLRASKPGPLPNLGLAA